MTNRLKFSNKYIIGNVDIINKLSPELNFSELNEFFDIQCKIDSSIDFDIIKPFTRDWSNIPGEAQLLVRPQNNEQAALILRTCSKLSIPITFSAGQTNLTGSATPQKGVIFSTKNLNKKIFSVNSKKKYVQTTVSIPLEKMRSKILEQTQNTLYYPVDPTSRNDALVGGTLSCNASGFIPGHKGATRYWVDEIEFMLINGFSLTIKRGDYISIDGKFILDCDGHTFIIDIPRYKRPNIKNASGPYSSMESEIDFIDLIIGSEGIFGLITQCKFNLADKPKKFLDLFLRLNNENQAIRIYQFLFNEFNGDMSQLSALEYFGHNCQKYMKNKEFLFSNSEEVGLYIQIPIFKGSISSKSHEWSKLLLKFDSSIDLSSINVLNDSNHWKKFFEARHSMPDNALFETKKLGGISIITDTIVPPKNFKKYLIKIHRKLQFHNIEYLLFGHLGDCHLHFHLIPAQDQQQLAFEVYDYMVDLSAKLGGVYSAEHGTGKRKINDFKKCYGKNAVTMLKNTKSGFDPQFLLNKGNIFMN